MDFDPSSATSLLDLQPDIPRGDDHDLQNPCLSNLHRSIFSFPSSESSGKNCSPGGGVVDEPVTAAAGPEELTAAGVTGILFFSHGSSPRWNNVPSSATSLLSSSTTMTNSKLRRNGRDGHGRPTRSSRPRPTAEKRRSGSAD